MSKSPEEYFKEQDFTVTTGSDKHFTPEEQAFMEKYMGIETSSLLQEIGISSAETNQAQKLASLTGDPSAPLAKNHERCPNASTTTISAPCNPLAGENAFSEDGENAALERLKQADELLMVAFYLGNQEFVIPTTVVQEVIKATDIIRLPAAPPFVAGVINLRGRVTPLIKLRDLLEVQQTEPQEDKFIVICQSEKLQLGLMIERVHTMYRISSNDITWNLEARLGLNVEFISGLLKQDEQLLGIVFVEKIIQSILNG